MSLWRPWVEDKKSRVDSQNPEDKGTTREHVSIGENEKKFVIDCYNCCQGKDWKDVLLFARKRVLPEQVVRMYLELSSDCLIQRMRYIVKNVLGSPKTLAGQSGSTVEAATLVKKQTKYSKRITPTEQKAEHIKRKIEEEFVDSSSTDSGAEEKNTIQGKKKRKIDHSTEAYLLHKQVCEKAMSTMDSVNYMLAKVDKYLDKNAK